MTRTAEDRAAEAAAIDAGWFVRGRHKVDRPGVTDEYRVWYQPINQGNEDQ